MKRLRQLLVALSLMVIGVQVAQAQVKLGDNPGSIDANALLELESTTKGFLLPRMSSAQRLAISSPSEGMMVYDLTANCTYIYRASAGNWYSLCAADSLTASNGLTKVGRDIQLGGTLTQVTNIAQGGNNLNITGNGSLGVGTNAPTANTRVDIVPNSGTDDPLALQGLRSGAATDSIMTVNAATGILKKRTLADVLSDQDQYVWKLDGNLTTAVRSLGTKSNFALPIITNNVERMRIAATGEVGIGTSSPTNKLTVEDTANPLKLVGLQGGATTDSIMTVTAAGIVKSRDVKAVVSAGLEVENGISKTDNKIRLGGTLNQATTLTTDATNTFAVAGLQGATIADSVVMADKTTGVLRRMSLADIGAGSFTANNGITKTGNNVALGGALVSATSITTDATNTLAVAGLQGATAADSVVMADKTSGVLRRMALADVGANSITANNGITKTGNNVALGGALTGATSITTTGTNTLAIAGLQGATTADSVVMADKTSGVLRRMSLADIGAGSFTADNGLTKTGNNVQLGGTLLAATTVAQAGNVMAFTGGNVGVGTATAPDRLTVSGNASVTNTGTVTTTLSDGTTTGQIKVTGNNTELSSTGTSGLQLSTGGTPAARMTVTSTGDVGIATASPTAKLHVAGSFAVPISSKTADYTATLDDHTLIFNLSSAAALTLPAASTCAGRTYVIIKGDATGNVLTLGSGIRLSTSQTMPSVNYNVRLHIQSDGTDWWLIARF